MNKVSLFMVIWSAANSMVQELYFAMADRVLTGSEFLRILKAGLSSLRFAGISSTDLDRLKLITTASEWQQLDFQDGDGAVFAPKELIDQLKVNVDKL